MEKKLRVAVIGVGHLGRHHARLLAGMAGVQLVGVVDIDEKVGGEIAKTYNVSYFKDYKELAGKVDAVTIVVPTSVHHEVAKFFMERDNHVFIEKPVTRPSRKPANC